MLGYKHLRSPTEENLRRRYLCTKPKGSELRYYEMMTFEQFEAIVKTNPKKFKQPAWESKAGLSSEYYKQPKGYY